MILLECTKTGRHAYCTDERAAYRKAQIMGMTDYTIEQVDAQPAPAVHRKPQRILAGMLAGVDTREMMG